MQKDSTSVSTGSLGTFGHQILQLFGKVHLHVQTTLLVCFWRCGRKAALIRGVRWVLLLAAFLSFGAGLFMVRHCYHNHIIHNKLPEAPYSMVDTNFVDYSLISPQVRKLCDSIKEQRLVTVEQIREWSERGTLPTWLLERYNNVTGFPVPIIPNIMHTITLVNNTVGWTQYLSVVSGLRFQKFDAIYIHTDKDELLGPYWDILKSHPRVHMNKVPLPSAIYNQPVAHPFHMSDVLRIYLMIKHGGFYLDSDTVILRSLEHFRHYESVIGWDIGSDRSIGDQLYLGHRCSRAFGAMLPLYRNYYPDCWYCNVGHMPTDLVLRHHTDWIHRVITYFGIHGDIQPPFLYRRSASHPAANDWQQYYAIHTLLNAYLRHSFLRNMTTTPDPHTIKTWDNGYGRMARYVLYDTEEMIDDDREPIIPVY